MRFEKIVAGGFCAAMAFTGCLSGEPERVAVPADDGVETPSQGALKEGTLLDAEGREIPIRYEQRANGDMVYQGDILLSPEDLGRGPLAKDAGSVPVKGNRIWYGGTIPYVTEGLDQARLNALNAAIDHWQTNTSIRFVARSNETTYVNIIADPAECMSYVGRQASQPQSFRISPSCGVQGIRHEIGHLVGLWHEHSRPDRDLSVQVNWQNIITAKRPEYDRWPVSEGLTTGPYDFASLMHAHSQFHCIKNASGACVGPTLVRRSNGASIPQAAGLSAGDINAVKVLYNSPLVYVQSGVGENAWTSTQVFKVGATSYLFSIRSPTGAARVRSVAANGTVGAVLHSLNLPAGMDITRFFVSGANTFLFALNSSTGATRMYRMNANGAPALQIGIPTVTPGFNTAEFYRQGNATFRFLMKSDPPEKRIHHVNADGSIGVQIGIPNWFPGFNRAAVLQLTATQAQLMVMNSSAGQFRIYKMAADGDLSPEDPFIYSTYQPNGWKLARYYRSGTSNFLLLYQSSIGGIFVYPVNADGSIGSIRNFGNWPDVNDVTHYAAGANTFLLRSSTSGQYYVERLGL